MKFYLGTHCLNHVDKSTVPLFLSNRVLMKRKKKRFNPQVNVSIDSGGFSELSLYGEWRTTPEEYIDNVRRMEDLNLGIDWIASQDYMCEDIMIRKTGLTVKEHQKKTIDKYIQLYDMNSGFEIVPILQGQTIEDYINHIQDYYERGFDLRYFKTVGVGSVCRRQNTQEIGNIMKKINSYGINIHGFGVKKQGLEKYGNYLSSADSLAWSFNARYNKEHCSKCYGIATTKNCANCLNYALEWRSKFIR